MPFEPVGHDPVLMNEVLDALALKPGQAIIDCTLGRGGHSRAVGERLGKDGLLVGLDVDPRNLAFANERLKVLECQVRLFEANFAQIDEVFQKLDRPAVDGILADLGLSTNQLFDEHYGLSFATPMPLDMRIDPNLSQSAADLVNKMPESDLANVLYELAQERHSRRIARKIAEARRISPIHTTDRLADLVRSAIPRGPKGNTRRSRETIDPATRTFLALRMKVNRETENLERLLERAPRILRSGGRLAVISFQSTEDRMVKQAFRSAEQTGLMRVLTSRPVSPTDDEIARNPRSRSAKLRVVEKL
ncbi:MAG: 16S rRNA (cytosine(1402)-N(4))-methyltransferase RsmH [Anaerolineae bacterium]|nr:16S rRNA (cytosine(1402)-N(4))-methyltransferase RsmH [Phycisphaerae bacterium]